MEQERTPGSSQEVDGLDQAVFERVWRRVMPEERADCPVRPGAVERAPQAAPEEVCAALPAIRETPAAREECPEPSPAQDVPCLGAASAVHGPQLQQMIDRELADYKTYQQLARRMGGPAGRVLAAMAAEERRHGKRLSTAYFLISGVRYWPVERVCADGSGTYLALLRLRFGEEQRGEAAYLAAAEETADPALRALFRELAGEENAHSWMIRGILEQQ